MTMVRSLPETLNVRAAIPPRYGKVMAVRESLITIHVESGALMKNEVGYICVGHERLKAEVLRIYGRTADMQVFEDTDGVRIGDLVEMSGDSGTASPRCHKLLVRTAWLRRPHNGHSRPPSPGWHHRPPVRPGHNR